MSESVRMAVIPPCDINPDHGKAAVDGKTTSGPWAYMCAACFKANGVGLGTGKGQQLVQAK